MPLTLDDLKTIIEQADFDKLVGEVENEFFDAKGQPYQFDAGDHAKREFAKDVTAFANAGGGCIFLGFRTEASSARLGEEIKEIRPLPPELIDPDRHHKLIGEWVYPVPKDLQVRWIPYEGGPKGIGVIYVPQQEGRSKPFLISKTIQDNKSTEILVGYAERNRDITDALTVGELHQALRTGLNMEREILGRFDNIESILDRFTQTTSKTEAIKKLAKVINDRVEFALQHDAMHEKRVLVLSAYPTEFSQLRTLFSKEADSIRRRLENPPDLRYSGWDLGTGDHANSLQGELARVTNGARKVIDLYRDGCLIFAGLADHNFLTHGMEIDQKLNSLALVEVILNFTRFYALVLNDLGERPPEVVFHVEFRNLHQRNLKTFLAPFQINSIRFRCDDGENVAPSDSWNKKFAVKTANYDADLLAYEIVREIYVWFGHTEEVIPYMLITDGKRIIDEKQIIAK